jgi:hypothetical protein
MAPLQRPTSSGQQQQQQQHAAPAGPEEAQQQDATLKSWVLQGYPLPSEEQSDSMAAVKAAYRCVLCAESTRVLCLAAEWRASACPDSTSS